eukprot:ctg_1864.g318
MRDEIRDRLGTDEGCALVGSPSWERLGEPIIRRTVDPLRRAWTFADVPFGGPTQAVLMAPKRLRVAHEMAIRKRSDDADDAGEGGSWSSRESGAPRTRGTSSAPQEDVDGVVAEPQLQAVLDSLRHTMGLPKRAPLEDVLIAAQQRLSSAGAADVLRRQISGGSVHLSRDGVCSLRRSQTDAQCRAVPSSSVFSEVTPSEMFTDQVAPEWAATRPREEWDEHVARTLCTPTNVGPDVLRTRALGVLMHLILEHSSSTPFPMAVRVFSHGGTMYQIYGNARTVYGHERDQLIGGNT